MTTYQNDIEAIEALKQQLGTSWDAINPEYVARMRAQNRFKTGLEIAQYTADIMRRDMAEYDADSSVYTQSLGVLARLHRAAEADLDQEAPQDHQQALPLPVGLDGRRAALGVRPAARPVDAREDLGAGADRGALHLPAPGRRPRARPALHASSTPPAPPATRRPRSSSSRRSTTTRPTSCRSSPTSTPASATPRPPTCWPRR